MVDDSKFDSFMNDVMAQKKSTSMGYDSELGDRKEEIIALYTEQNISRRVIFDSLVKAGIINEDRALNGFSHWMSRSIKKSIKANAEKDKNVYRVEDDEGNDTL